MNRTGALIIEDNKVLLVKRSMDSRNEPGLWARPGGEVEKGETPEETVIREVREELGIDIRVIEKFDTCEHCAGDDHWTAYGFLAEIVNGTPSNMEPGKHDEVKWWPLDNLASYARQAIDKYTKSNL